MKHTLFITEGLACQAEIYTYVSRCLGERLRRKDAMKEQTKGIEEELGFSSNIFKI